MWRSIFDIRRGSLGPPPRLAGARILLLEELVEFGRTLASALSAAGADVDLECDRRSAEETILRRGVRWYDAIVYRTASPSQEGARLADRLEGLGIACPIVVLASASEIDSHPENDRRFVLVDCSSLAGTLRAIDAELANHRRRCRVCSASELSDSG